VTVLARGRRVDLHAPSARDRDEFLDAVDRSRRLHGRWVAPPTDAEAFAGYLRRVRRRNAAGLLVRRHDGGDLVGSLTLSQIVPDPFRSGYLGYYAFAPHQGQGLMSEALDLTLTYAFGPLRLHRVEANVQPGNAASIALVQRAGFRLEGYSPRYLKVAGRWRDHERWAITVEDRRTA
jgi:[ribosomal protein S5]-alanine N-acetyltransferase